MPYYSYSNPNTGEIKDIFQHMNDTHEYSEEGVEWKRLWHKPQAAENTQLDPFSEKDYINKLGSTKGTMADCWERSGELSEKRASLAGGADPVRKAYLDEYSKKRHGAKHPDEVKKFLKEAVIRM